MHKLDNLGKYLTEKQIDIIEEKIIESLNKFETDTFYYDNLTIKFNNRLRTVAGYFKTNNATFESIIELNPKYIKNFGFDHILKTFSHELAHFVVWSLGKERGHSEDFKRICVEFDGHMNSDVAGETYKNSVTTEWVRTDYKWHYKCKCGACNCKTKRRLGKRKLNSYCSVCETLTIDMETKL